MRDESTFHIVIGVIFLAIELTVIELTWARRFFQFSSMDFGRTLTKLDTFMRQAPFDLIVETVSVMFGMLIIFTIFGIWGILNIAKGLFFCGNISQSSSHASFCAQCGAKAMLSESFCGECGHEMVRIKNG